MVVVEIKESTAIMAFLPRSDSTLRSISVKITVMMAKKIKILLIHWSGFLNIEKRSFKSSNTLGKYGNEASRNILLKADKILSFIALIRDGIGGSENLYIPTSVHENIAKEINSIPLFSLDFNLICRHNRNISIPPMNVIPIRQRR
jgi:hypothetical protein